MNEERIILPDSDEAASIQRAYVKEWVSRHGRFFGHDEQAARWDGATHVKCEKCGKPTPKTWLVCEKCREKQAVLNYLSYPVVRWTEDVPIYSQVTGKYYYDRDEVRDDNIEGFFYPIFFQLVLCEPIYAVEVDPELFYEDLLPDEDCELHPVLVDAFCKLNDTIREAKIVLSFEPTNVAVV